MLIPEFLICVQYDSFLPLGSFQGQLQSILAFTALKYPKNGYFRSENGSKTSGTCEHFSQCLRKYLEFLHFVKNSEFSTTSSIRIKATFADPPIPLNII